MSDLHRCLAEAHDFVKMHGTLSPENQKRLGRTDIVGWAWCKFCGSVLEVMAGPGQPAVITPPRLNNSKSTA